MRVFYESTMIIIIIIERIFTAISNLSHLFVFFFALTSFAVKYEKFFALNLFLRMSLALKLNFPFSCSTKPISQKTQILKMKVQMKIDRFKCNDA